MDEGMDDPTHKGSVLGCELPTLALPYDVTNREMPMNLNGLVSTHPSFSEKRYLNTQDQSLEFIRKTSVGSTDGGSGMSPL